MHRSRPTSYCVRSLLLLVPLLVAAACGGNDSVTAPTPLGLDASGMASLLLDAGGTDGQTDTGDVSITAFAQDATGAPVAGVPVSFVTTEGEFVGGPQAITDVSGRATVLLRVDEEAMVMATGGGLRSPELYVSAAGAIRFIFRFKGNKADAGETETFFVQATSADGGAVRGKLDIDFGDGRSKRLDFSRRADVPHIFRSAGNFRIRVKIEDDRGRSGRGSFRLRVGGRVAIALQVTGDTAAKPGEETAHRIRATRSDGEEVAGTVFIDFGDGSSDTVEGFRFEQIVLHHYVDEGQYTVTARLIADNGREARATKSMNIRAGGSGADDLDLSQVNFLHANITDWEIDSTVTSVTVSPSLVCIFHTKAGAWPVVDGAEGNPWVFAKVGGSWYGGTFEWLRPGQQCKGVTRENIGQHVKQVPMISWVPQDGDEVCWGMSTHARFGPQSPRQLRSNIRCGTYRFGTVVRGSR